MGDTFIQDDDFVTIAADRNVSGKGDIVLMTGGVERARVTAAGVGSGLLGGSMPATTVKQAPYSAVGDGVANDGVAITSAFTAAGTSLVVFPFATYLVSALTSLLFSKIDGLGSTLKPSANTMSVLTLKSGSLLQSGDFLIVRNLLIDGTGKTGITGVDNDGAAAGYVASGILENIYVVSADTVAFNFQNAQFLRTYNLRATLGNGVGFLIRNNVTSGGANSHDHYGLHAIQKEVGVVVNGTAYSTPATSLNFYNPQVLGNSVCGMAFFAANATIYGGAPENNASGAATKVVDGQTVKKSSLQCNNSTVRLVDVYVAEALANPCFIVENSGVLVLENLSGYGNANGSLVQADATSGVVLSGSFAGAGLVQNVVSWPDAWVLPASAQVIMYGEPVLTIDPTIVPLYARQAPALTAQGAQPPVMSYVEDVDLGYCRQAAFTAFAGATLGNAAIISIGAGAASQDSVISVLVKSNIDTNIGINFYDGASYNAINTTSIFLKAGKVTRLIYGKRSIPAGAWQLFFFPVGADAPTIAFSNFQAFQGPTGTQTTSAAIAKIGKLGAFSPGPIRATAANLALLAATVNTAGKYPGKQVWDTTNNRPVFAAGEATASVWKDGVNSTVYTPI